MLTTEELDILGLCAETRFTGKASNVSQALRAIRDDVEQGKSEEIAAGTEEHDAQCRIIVASNRAARERAYALAYRVYRRSGYATEGDRGLCVSPFDACAQTLTLLAQDSAGNDHATISLVFDSAEGLPCDEIYRPEVDALRARGCQLAEVTRLAIEQTGAEAKSLLLQLFNQCYIFARIVRNASDLVVEVNPAHVKYYQRLLHFQQSGPERPCSRVQGAPAVLLRLNLPEIEAAVKGTGCTKGRDLNGRRLHPFPYSRLEEESIARSLASQHRPMSAEDARYFRLQRPEPMLRTVFAAAGN